MLKMFVFKYRMEKLQGNFNLWEKKGIWKI